MTHVRHNTNYPSSFPMTHDAQGTLGVGEPVSGTGVSSVHLPRWIAPVLVVALVISAGLHGGIALATWLTQAPVDETPVASYHRAALAVEFDWDAFAGFDSGLAPLDAEEASAPELPSEPEVVAQPVAARIQQERDQRPVKEIKTEEAVVENAVVASPVEALVESSSGGKIDLPSGSGTVHPSSATSANNGSTSGRSGLGPNRAEGGIGDGHGIDIAGVRKEHVAALNRNIRKQNPCTRELSHYGLSGDVVLGLLQNADGSVRETRVLRSSGDARIDQAARDFVQGQGRLPRPNDALLDDVWQVGLRFRCGG